MGWFSLEPNLPLETTGFPSQNQNKTNFSFPQHLWLLSSPLRENLSWVITLVTVLSGITPPRSLLWSKYSKSISHTQTACWHTSHTLSDFSRPQRGSVQVGGVRVKGLSPQGHPRSRTECQLRFPQNVSLSPPLLLDDRMPKKADYFSFVKNKPSLVAFLDES